MDAIIDQVNLKFTSLSFFEDYVISEINEGVSFGTEEIVEVHDVIKKIYGDKRYSYISLRHNDYNVNPADYLSCRFYDQLKGLAVICKSGQSKSTADLEKTFFKGKYEVFDSIDQALEWVRTLE